ncbi:MAG: nucleotide sugar dehydrogenase [Candidatus Eisenbacteria bacterium]|uniref:Nucleotide sugar dehydrogenase n=1 Tax=Eiseniibacteriota bacterium TaxID=2212470 RepID=A0A956NBW9_UNCEI|nr:nucleotide sugar dehydrogenase [Candidatus Eisenbacteria bacterium]MCB9462767.1 nucleotide sugar dehydrogenase [Candidatus Eisenbacteria bacterium]
MSLLQKIERREAHLGVLGMGYVGLPLAMEFCKAGFHVTGFDVDAKRVAQLADGISYIKDVPSEEVARFVKEGLFRPTIDFDLLAEVDTVNICVPTPLRKTKDPDVSYIVSAVSEIKKRLHSPQLVLLESTTYPGTTVELVLPELEETGLQVGKDFFLGFSPERVDPGNPVYQTKNIPKVVGGVTPECSKLAAALYGTGIDTVVPVSSPQVAEMVKLLENTFRSVNIGLVNELALLCKKMGINVWEVIDAAATKPFGFMPFYPGPGLGGHCIPVDPFYLSWKARAAGFEARFIELAGMVNGAMPDHVGMLVAQALNNIERSVKGSRVMALGVAYKADIDDVRESPALDVIEILRRMGADVVYHDRYVPHLHLESDGSTMESVPLDEKTLANVQCVVVTTAHKGIDYGWVLSQVPAMVDTRNCLPNVEDPKLVRL